MKLLIFELKFMNLYVIIGRYLSLFIFSIYQKQIGIVIGMYLTVIFNHLLYFFHFNILL